MAKFSQTFLQGLLQPSYQEGLFTAARGIGAAPQMRALQQQQQAEKQAEIDILNNLKKAALAKASKGVDAATAKARVQSMNIAQLQEYLKPSTPSEFTLSPGEKRFKGSREIASVPKETSTKISYVTDDILNTETNNLESVRIGFDESNNIVSKQVLGVVPSKDGKGGAGSTQGKASLAEYFKNAGIEVDLDTIDGLRQAERAAYYNLSNASLANTIAELIEEKKEPGVTQGLEILRTNPSVAKAEEDLILVGKYRALEGLSETDTAGISRLLQRTLTSTVPNDIKALQEMQLFVKSQGLKDRVDDFFSMAVNGTLTQETFQEYSDVIQAIEDFSNYQIISAARNLAVFGNAKEQLMADKVIGYYGGSTARVVD
jgi:hypothetical protein